MRDTLTTPEPTRTVPAAPSGGGYPQPVPITGGTPDLTLAGAHYPVAVVSLGDRCVTLWLPRVDAETELVLRPEEAEQLAAVLLEQAEIARRDVTP